MQFLNWIEFVEKFCELFASSTAFDAMQCKKKKTMKHVAEWVQIFTTKINMLTHFNVLATLVFIRCEPTLNSFRINEMNYESETLHDVVMARFYDYFVLSLWFTTALISFLEFNISISVGSRHFWLSISISIEARTNKT